MSIVLPIGEPDLVETFEDHMPIIKQTTEGELQIGETILIGSEERLATIVGFDEQNRPIVRYGDDQTEEAIDVTGEV